MLKLLIADGIPQQAELVRKALEKEFVICFADGQNFRELLGLSSQVQHFVDELIWR